MKLSDVADTVQGDWVVLAQQLHISISDINHIKTDYKTVSDQALAMLYLWAQKNGDKATGIQLENALRRINRDDVVRKCLHTVVTVDDEMEAAAARVAMDQSGFDTFKEEVGITKDSLKRGMSLDVQYDEQDIIKESESATEESPTFGRGYQQDEQRDETQWREDATHSRKVTASYPEDWADNDYMEASIDERRPQVQPPKSPTDDDEESHRRKAAYLDFALQLNQLAEMEDSRLSHQDSDEQSAPSIGEDEIVKTSKASIEEASSLRAEFSSDYQDQQDQVPDRPHVTFSEQPETVETDDKYEEYDEDKVLTPPPSPTDKLDTEEPVLATESNIAEVATRLVSSTDEQSDTEDKDGIQQRGQPKAEREIMYSRAEIVPQDVVSSFQGTQHVSSESSSQVLSPLSDGGSSYHDEPSPVPEPQLPEDFKSDELAYDRTEDEGDDESTTHEKITYDNSRDVAADLQYVSDLPLDDDSYRTSGQSLENEKKNKSSNVPDGRFSYPDQLSRDDSNLSTTELTDFDSAGHPHGYTEDDAHDYIVDKSYTEDGHEEYENFHQRDDSYQQDIHESHKITDESDLRSNHLASGTSSSSSILAPETFVAAEHGADKSTVDDDVDNNTEVLSGISSRENTTEKKVDHRTVAEQELLPTQEGPSKSMDVVSEGSPEKEETQVEEHEEVLADGTVHRVRKVRTHSVKKIMRSVKSLEGEEIVEEKEIVPGSLREDVVETFDEPPRLVRETEDVEHLLDDGTKVNRRIIYNRMVHRMRTHQESFDSDHGLQTEDFEIDEVIPGTESAFVAGNNTSDESDDESNTRSLDDDLEDFENNEEDMDDDTTDDQLMTAENSIKFQTGSDSPKELEQARVEQTSLQPYNPSDENRSKSTTVDETLKTVGDKLETVNFTSSKYDQQQEAKATTDSGETVSMDQAAEDTTEMYPQGSEPYGYGAYSDDNVQTHRVVMKKEVHSRTMLGDDGQEETTINEDTQIQQDNEPPEELQESMQEIIRQFMESDPQPARLPESESLEDEV
uniref:Death domain-containing protein n=1 Tax=Arion vulgaris TaxID=1028688 RepID=A0A0B7BJ29_9EUPU